MDHYSSPEGTWTMIPTPNSNSQIQSQSNPDLYLQQQRFLQQKSQFQQLILQKQQQQTQQQHQNLHQSLISHFHRLNLEENLAEVVEHGNPNQQSDALTVDGQKKKLEEIAQLLNQRRDLMANYTKYVEKLVKSEP